MTQMTKSRGDRKAEDKAARRGRVKIKLCGLSRPCDIQAANELKPDYIGFVFAPKSRRYVPPEKAAELKRMLDPQIRSAGVFVDGEPQVIGELVRRDVIDVVQLHGKEDEDYIRRLRERLEQIQRETQQELKQARSQVQAEQKSQLSEAGDRIRIIKAFSIGTEQDAETANASSADCILVDSPGGGTGTVFDWDLLRKIRRPYFLAGGLTPDNVGDAVNMLRPYGVDVSSGIETGGYKDRNKMAEFVSAVRRAPGVDHYLAENSADRRKDDIQ